MASDGKAIMKTSCKRPLTFGSGNPSNLEKSSGSRIGAGSHGHSINSSAQQYGLNVLLRGKKNSLMSSFPQKIGLIPMHRSEFRISRVAQIGGKGCFFFSSFYFWECFIVEIPRALSSTGTW